MSFRNPWTGRDVFAASAMVCLCAVFVVALPATAAGDYLASDFFPLSGNLSGIYHMWGDMDEGQFCDFMLTTKVSPQQVNIRGYDAWEVELWRDGQKGDSQFYTEDPTGIGWIQKPYREYASPHMFLPVSLVLGETSTDTVDVWQTWEDGTFLSGSSWRSVTPIGMETVAVEAGTFSALRVDWQEISTMYWTTTGGTEMKEVCDGDGSMWFVQGQGMLKRTEVGSEANFWLDGGNWVQGQTDYQDHTMELVPEPASLALLGIGGFALLGRRRAA